MPDVAANAPTDPISQPTNTSEAPLRLRLPLLIDSEAGRIYAATEQGATSYAQTWVLSAKDGRLLDTYEFAGPIALDAARQQLAVDQGDEGLAILDAQTGDVLRTIELLPLTQDQQSPAPPQADPATGQFFAMRANVVYAVDPETGGIEPLAELDLRPQDNCRQPHDMVLPIVDSYYDSAKRILYLSYVSYSCIPWIGYAVIAYDVGTGAEIGHGGGSIFAATAFDGRFYADDWYRMGSGTLWTMRGGKPWTTSTNWSSGARPLLIDSTRRRLFWDTGESLRVFDADEMRLLMVIPPPYAGGLAGYDPATDQLYFGSENGLQTYPAGAIAPPQPALGSATALPRQPVTQLVVSPGWPQDKTLAGIWGYSATTDDCYVWGGRGGTIYLSSDGGTSWRASSTGLPSGCEIVSALALAPDYERDRTLLAAIAGAGIFKSIDGGASWTPASWGLPSMHAYWLEVSPGFARDGTAFASVPTGTLQRTTDRGASWHSLPITTRVMTLSPEFEQDRTLVAFVSSELWTSRDGGEHWEITSIWPGSEGPSMLSAAPLYAAWRVLFAYTGNGQVFRSADAGASWQTVLDTGLSGGSTAQIVYAPDVEVNRPVFLLATGPFWEATPDAMQSALFRSLDGGLSWQKVTAGDGVVPTALTISPTFAQDGLIFVGTAGGQVLTLNGLALPASSS